MVIDMEFIAYFKDENSFIKPKKVQIKEDGDKTIIFDEYGQCVCNGIPKSSLIFFNDLKSAEAFFKDVTKDCSTKFKNFVFNKKRKVL